VQKELLGEFPLQALDRRGRFFQGGVGQDDDEFLAAVRATDGRSASCDCSGGIRPDLRPVSLVSLRP
jgi:hypothetical protein